ncbi:TPR repeat-containing protein, partial [Candidatus Magnetomorum sp. HK-1]
MQQNNSTQYNLGDFIEDRFKIFDISIGGMCEVYHCLDTKQIIPKPIALKTIRKKSLQEIDIGNVLKNETHTWIKLGQHPNIVRCYWYDTLDNIPFICLELIPSQPGTTSPSLSNLIKQEKLNIKDIFQIIIDVTKGLEYAQRKIPNFVHLDLKPNNILIAPDQQAKISDFGISRIGGQNSNITGSPFYMAPEIWDCNTTDQRTDIYALGCILFEMLNGLPPFTSDSADQLEQMHKYSLVPKIDVKIENSYQIDELIRITLSKKKQDRFSDFSTFFNYLIKIYNKLFRTEPIVDYKKSIIHSNDHLNWGFSLANIGRYHDAINEYNKAIELNPLYYLAYNNKGDALNKIGKYNEAIESLNKAISLNSRRETAYLNIAISYYRLENDEKALKYINHSLSINPQYSKAFALKGMIFFETNKLDESESYLQQALKYNRFNILANYGMGLIKNQQKEYAEAIKYFNYAEQIDKDNINIYFQRAMAYDELKKYDEALFDYAKVIHDKQYVLDAILLRAETYIKTGKTNEAINDYSKLLSINPNHIEALFNKAVLLYEKDKIVEAISDYSKILEMSPNNSKALSNRGICFYDLGKHKEAISDYSKAIQIQPDNSIYYSNRANAYGEIHKFKECLLDQTKLIELEPFIYTKYM